jgi:hypothetical protein
MKTHVTYDSRSGQIISVQHGAADAAFALRQAHRRLKIAQEHLAAIEIGSDAMRSGKLYKVDPKHKTLVEVQAGEKGSGFAGGTGRKP